MWPAASIQPMGLPRLSARCLEACTSEAREPASLQLGASCSTLTGDGSESCWCSRCWLQLAAMHICRRQKSAVLEAQ